MDNCKDGICSIGDVAKIDNRGYGLTKYGFRRKLYPECVADRIKRARKVFGVNIDTCLLYTSDAADDHNSV